MDFINDKNIENCLKIAIAGNVDSGKSSLIGVLSSKKLDNGRGSARESVLVNKHEKSSGRTSCISFNEVRYDLDKKKILTLIDLAGHEKYFKTTIFGLTGLYPDYGIVVVGANMGINKMTKEHLGLMLYLKIPIIVVITKIDICPENVYENTKNKLRKILKVPIFNKKPFFISRDNENAKKDVNKYLSLKNNTLIPVISISNKTGHNLDLLNHILYNLRPRVLWDKNMINGSKIFIDSVYQVKGIGIVVSGTLKGESINVNQKLWMGPIKNKFIQIRIRSMHNNIRENIETLNDKEIGCFALKFLGKEEFCKEDIKKGTLIFSDEKFKNNVTNKFEAKITILNHSTTISNNYQPVINCGLVRQSAKLKIIKIFSDTKKNNVLRTGVSGLVEFEFSIRPEFVEKGEKFFFRDGNTKGFGEITKILNN